MFIEEKHIENKMNLICENLLDLCQIVKDLSLLQNVDIRLSFIKYVQINNKIKNENPLLCFEDIEIVTALVQIYKQLINILNQNINSIEEKYVFDTVDATRGEIMLCLASQLVNFYTYVTKTDIDQIQRNLLCKRLLLTGQLCHLYKQVDKYCRDNIKSDFSIEWESVFASDCREILLNIWTWYPVNNQYKTIPDCLVINILSDTLSSDPKVVCNLSSACSLLLMPSRSIQLTAYHLICKHRLEKYEDMAQILISAQTVVAAMLEHFSLGDTCIVVPNTDSFTYTLGYLLIWSIIIEKCEQADSSVRLEVAMWLKQEGFIFSLMKNLIRLMPDEIVHCNQNLSNVQHMFKSGPSLYVTDLWDSNKLTHLVCSVYYNILKRFPALIRQCWNETSSSESNLIEKLTCKYVSPLLCGEELKTAAKFTQENMNIRVFPGTKEVVATYTLEDASMEITISLPSNHPLGVIKIDSSKNLFPNTQWIKQITKFLIHANGSICDGLSSWKNNMDKRFEDVEECYICFCILHSRNHELPRKSCRTCSKKFHSYCLFKWFTTSNKSTCPICRNLF